MPSAVATTEIGPLTQKIQKSGIHKTVRYVKLNIPVESWVFMDEIEVFGTADTSGDRVKPSPQQPKEEKGIPLRAPKMSQASRTRR